MTDRPVRYKQRYDELQPGYSECYEFAPLKMTVGLVGAFRELDLVDSPDQPSLADVRGQRPLDHKAEVVAYLRAGKPMVVSPGEEATDVFDPTKRTTTRGILTDGTYAWSKELAYYVEHYDIALGSLFENHMARRGYRMLDVDTSQLTLPWW